MANMRNNHHNSTCKCKAASVSTDSGTTFGDVYYDSELISPVCMSSVLSGTGSSTKDFIYFAGPDTTSGRTNGALKKSSDGGKTWTSRKVW